MQERVCVGKRLKIGIRASSTLARYKSGRRENDKVMYNFEQPLYMKATHSKKRLCCCDQKFVILVA